MALKQLIYQAAKKTVNAMPRWLLRLRPFEIYEIKSKEASKSTVAKPTSETVPESIKITWVETAEELDKLRHLAVPKNLEDWDRTVQNALVCWQEISPEVFKAVGIAWINSESFEEPELGIRYHFPSDATWLHSAHVLSDYRRQGIYQKLLANLMTEMSDEESCKRVLLGVTFGNEASRKAHLKMDATKIGSILLIRFLGLSCCINRGAVRPKGLRIGAKINLTVD